MKQVLLIEDNQSLREEILNVLELEGFTVVTAENGRVGLERLATHRPDLVICDLMMPEMDGYETLKAIRGNPAIAMLPILMLTARDDDGCVSKAMELGADGYVTKPFRIAELLEVVDSIQKKRRKERPR